MSTLPPMPLIGRAQARADSRTYTNADQLTSIVATMSPNTLTSFTYTLDDAGLRTAVQTPGGLEVYTYDNLYRLTGVTYPDLSTQAFTYDAVGNRLTKVQGGNTTTYTYDDADRMTAAGPDTYTYDNNGSLKSGPVGGSPTTHCWDAENRLRATTSAASCPFEPIRVNAGGGVYTDTGGRPWQADINYTGNRTTSTGTAIANTDDDPLYQNDRNGDFSSGFSYTFPGIPAGDYTVTLKFAELNWDNPGTRKFDVLIEGALVLDDFDINAAAGGRYKAVDRSFNVTVADGTLNLQFNNVAASASVSAIEVVQTTPPATTLDYRYRVDGLGSASPAGR